ncbi:MAG: hypothetical protein HKM89_13910 [Gemmatimonadales bacterium]|nr:hypothetical protein [Gemmatimonadales bacterium]
MKVRIAVLVLALAWPAGLNAQEAADSAGITQAALDYIEGWYEGNADRMTRALHPDLVKRIVADRDGSSRIQGMTAEQLIAYTAGGGGSRTPAEKRRAEVKILDVFGNAASVRVDAAEWIDYLQIGKVDGEWKILNVLWEFRPEVKAKMMERQKQAED